MKHFTHTCGCKQTLFVKWVQEWKIKQNIRNWLKVSNSNKRKQLSTSSGFLLEILSDRALAGDKAAVGRTSGRGDRKRQVTLPVKEQEGAAAAGAVLREDHRQQSGGACSPTRQCKRATTGRVTRHEPRHHVGASRFSSSETMNLYF